MASAKQANDKITWDQAKAMLLVRFFWELLVPGFMADELSAPDKRDSIKIFIAARFAYITLVIIAITVIGFNFTAVLWIPIVMLAISSMVSFTKIMADITRLHRG